MNKGNVPVKIWSPIEQVESQALDQLTNIANLPCVFKHVAVMPDVHLGKGATVGSVVATKGAIVPAAVGGDAVTVQVYGSAGLAEGLTLGH
jgi:tRNA-splicing ligase RtcB